MLSSTVSGGYDKGLPRRKTGKTILHPLAERYAFRRDFIFDPGHILIFPFSGNKRIGGRNICVLQPQPMRGFSGFNRMFINSKRCRMKKALAIMVMLSMIGIACNSPHVSPASF